MEWYWIVLISIYLYAYLTAFYYQAMSEKKQFEKPMALYGAIVVVVFLAVMPLTMLYTMVTNNIKGGIR